MVKKIIALDLERIEFILGTAIGKNYKGDTNADLRISV